MRTDCLLYYKFDKYMKVPSSNLGRTCCVQKLFLTFRTIFVHNMFSPCSAKRRVSDKDLPVPLPLSVNTLYVSPLQSLRRPYVYEDAMPQLNLLKAHVKLWQGHSTNCEQCLFKFWITMCYVWYSAYVHMQHKKYQFFYVKTRTVNLLEEKINKS